MRLIYLMTNNREKFPEVPVIMYPLTASAPRLVLTLKLSWLHTGRADDGLRAPPEGCDA